MTTTRCGNAGVGKNSKMASRYATPAIASGMRKDGAPKLPNLRAHDRERHEHDGAENVESAGWSEPHKSPREGLSCSTACLHCANQAAVRGALDGKSPQFLGQPYQVSRHVDVVKNVCCAHRKTERAGAFQQPLKRARRSHSVAHEKPRIVSFGSDQIVASVVCRSHNHIASSERLECFLQHGCRQMRAVAVECDDAPPVSPREVREHRSKAGSQSLTSLCDNTCDVARQPSEILHIRSGAHNGDLGIAQRLRQRQCVVKKAAIKRGDSR